MPTIKPTTKEVVTNIEITSSEEVVKEEEYIALEDRLFSPYSQVLTRLGFGGLLGFSAGYAVKQASKAAAVFVGTAVVFLQTLNYFGYIEVKWAKIQKDLMRSVSSEGKDTFGIHDVTFWTRKMVRVLTHQAPQAGGFGMGIYLGLGM